MAGCLVVCPRPVVSGAFLRPVGSAVAGPVWPVVNQCAQAPCSVVYLNVQWPGRIGGPVAGPVVCPVLWPVVQLCVQVMWSVVNLSVQWPAVAWQN